MNLFPLIIIGKIHVKQVRQYLPIHKWLLTSFFFVDGTSSCIQTHTNLLIKATLCNKYWKKNSEHMRFFHTCLFQSQNFHSG